MIFRLFRSGRTQWQTGKAAHASYWLRFATPACRKRRGWFRTAGRMVMETRREAPTTSTDSDIVDAAQGKADKRIDDLRQRYDALDCPADSAARRNRLPPLQPAPGGGNR